ncbi:hypothetical protein Mlab_1034 [Methanocorpusculum labreanum Z]|uniref:Uncharacterized protein n=1 Tax=Methanocorpusculum labreanum (strain ATCC 43576 / DSM 4855 / Z) TaxID=410358 RepID=A2SS97_METLZ|nr:hypothetical protein Mlab_1034 [Methanocorpusculum labreanum Z]
MRHAAGAKGDQSYPIFIEAGTLLEGVRSVYSIVIVWYFDIWREFFGGVPTSTTILDGKRDITRGKCLDFSVFFMAGRTLKAYDIS